MVKLFLVYVLTAKISCDTEELAGKKKFEIVLLWIHFCFKFKCKCKCRMI